MAGPPNIEPNMMYRSEELTAIEYLFIDGLLPRFLKGPEQTISNK